MENRAKLTEKNYRLRIEFFVDVMALHMVDAEGQGWESRLRVNGSGEIPPENVEVERVGEY